jgi:hypothetical protein
MLEKQFVVSCNTNKFFWQQDFQITVKKKSAENTCLLFSQKPQKSPVIRYYGLTVMIVW